jgi:hypothetical protein
MKTDRNGQLSLDRPATYEIRVPGEIELNWEDWEGRLTVAIEADGDNPPITIDCDV